MVAQTGLTYRIKCQCNKFTNSFFLGGGGGGGGEAGTFWGKLPPPPLDRTLATTVPLGYRARGYIWLELELNICVSPCWSLLGWCSGSV